MTKMSVYDNELKPLIEQLHKLAQKHDLAMFTSFDMTDEEEKRKELRRMVSSHIPRANGTSIFGALVTVTMHDDGMMLIERLASTLHLLPKIEEAFASEIAAFEKSQSTSH